MTDINSLRQKRAKLVDEARAILDRGAKPQGRARSGDLEFEIDSLSTADAEQFDKIMGEVEGLAAQIERIDRQHESDRRSAELELGGRAEGMFSFRTADGGTVPGLLADHRLAELPSFGGRSRSDIFGETDPDDLSIGRMLRGYLTGDWRDAEAEEAAIRAQTTTIGADGGFIVPAGLSSVLLDEVRSSSVLVPAGAITVPMSTQSLDIARVEESPTGEFRAVGEELVTLPNTNIKLGRIALRAKTFGAIVDISEELAQDGAGAEEMVRSTLADALGSQLDRAFLRGQEASDDDTADERLQGGQSGVLDDPDIQEITGVAAPHWDDLVDGITKAAEVNAVARVAMLTPRDMGNLEKLKDATSGLYLRPPDSVAALRKFQSNQLPNDGGTTQALVGNLTSGYVVLGVRNAFKIEASRVAGDSFDKYGIKVRIVGRYDIQVGRPKHLVALKGITAP